MLTLTGAGLRPEQLQEVIDGAAVLVDPSAWSRVEASRRALLDAIGRRRVYGRSTGVGANHSVTVTAADSGLRLLRSHAGGTGELVEPGPARALLVVRANQLLAGSSGVEAALIETIVAAVNSGAYPALHEVGSIGTSDLTALAELALTVLGERPWIGAGPPPFAIDRLDALALLSSSALTIAQAALAYSAAVTLADAALVVAALTFVALAGSPEPYAAEVQHGKPHPGTVAAAARFRALIEPVAGSSERIQDPFGLRVLAPVHGVLLDSLDRLRAVLLIELNAGAENPLVSATAADVFHHGNFDLSALSASLDDARLALLRNGQLGASRISALLEPQFTGLTPFLADTEGDSGLMIIEYTAASALARLRAAAMPVAFGSVVISRGVESHASFAGQATRQLVDALAAYRIVLAAELVTAVRALRMSGRVPGSPALESALAQAGAGLSDDRRDRPLEDDLAAAASVLDGLGRAVAS